MGKIANLGLAGLLAFSLGCGKPILIQDYKTNANDPYIKEQLRIIEKEKIDLFEPVLHKRVKLKDTIGSYDNIELKKLNELDFSYQEKLETPEDLEYILTLLMMEQDYKDKEIFRNNLYEKYDLSKLKVAEMSPLEIITKTADIIADNFKYRKKKDVNIKIPIEDDFNSRKGDCGMYAHFMIKIFNLLKEDNKKSVNVYIGKARFRKKIEHDWNTIYILSRNKLQFSMIDPTLYDNEENGELDANDDSHIDKNWKIEICEVLEDHNELLRKNNEANKNAKLASLNRHAFIYFLAGEYNKSIEAYEILGILDKTKVAESLYYEIRSYSELGEKQKATEKKETLLKEYPDSSWSNKIMNNYF